MELDDLRCFVAVADELHFGRAAARLGVKPSNMSRRIRLLERELRVELFVRTSRRVRLSKAGTELLDDARNALAAIAALSQRATVLAAGSSPSAVITYTAFTNHVARLLRAEVLDAPGFAGVECQMLTDEEAVVASVLAGDSDVGITMWADPRVDVAQIESPETYYLLVPSDHRLAGRGSVRVEDLDGEPLLLFDRSQNVALHDECRRFYEERGIYPVFKVRRILSLEQAHDFAATGQGVVHTRGSAAIPDGTVRVPTRGQLPPIDAVYVVWNRTEPGSAAAAIVDVARRLGAASPRS